MNNSYYVRDSEGRGTLVDGVTGDICIEETVNGYRVTLSDDNGVLLMVDNPISLQRITEGDPDED